MNNSENRLNQMLEDDPVPLGEQAASGDSALARVKALKGRSVSARPKNDAAEQDVARQTAEVLGWAKPGETAGAPAPAKRGGRRRRDPNAEPVDVLYARVPRSAYQVFMRYCEANGLTQADGIVALTGLLPKHYHFGPPDSE